MRGRAETNLTTPFVSVVMPVRNEAHLIEHSLRCVLAQDYPRDRIEVIVVDGDSEDATAAIVSGIAAEAAIPVRLLRNPNRTQPFALNLARTKWKGDVFVRVDGHCLVESDYVRNCVEALSRTGADNVGGVQRPAAETLMGRAISLATTSRFGIGNARFRYLNRGAWTDTVYLGAYRRDALERVGPWDEELSGAEDDDFNVRLVKAGGRIWLDPSIRVTYRPRESLSALWRQFFRYGLYKVRALQKTGWSSRRPLVPPTFVLLLLAGAGLFLITRRALWAVIVPCAYVAVNVAASLIASRKDPAAALLVPPALVTLHLAYGFGFLWGVWKWRRSFVGRR